MIVIAIFFHPAQHCIFFAIMTIASKKENKNTHTIFVSRQSSGDIYSQHKPTHSETASERTRPPPTRSVNSPSSQFFSSFLQQRSEEARVKNQQSDKRSEREGTRGGKSFHIKFYYIVYSACH
jgi:hypothetical protein